MLGLKRKHAIKDPQNTKQTIGINKQVLYNFRLFKTDY